ncbi:MAG: phosphate butyryltransferase [Muribaculaceae bacterium]|nr:phosphate butyryltransferase [Muribaculaceae bacterium]
MQLLTNFDAVIDKLAARHTPARVAVVCPHDSHTSEAVTEAARRGIARFILIGDPSREHFPSIAGAETIVEPDADRAAALAVAMAREGKTDVIMKGLINTDNLLRAVLNRETGILCPGAVLTHITAAEIPGHDKLLFFSDAAVIPFPDSKQLEAMTRGLIDLCRRMGIEQPRVALIHCSEKSSPKFPVTESYSELKRRCTEGAFGNAIVDGPMDLKTAVDAESAVIKGIDSPVAGKADALVFPDIEAGNVFYKTIVWLGHGTNAGIISGAKVPVVLPSRSDSTHSKLCSLALAATAATGC